MNLSNRRVKEITSLRRRKYRMKLGEYLVEGLRSVASALAAADVREIVVDGRVLEQPDVVEVLDTSRAPVAVVDEATFRRFSDVETSQGILAVVAMPDKSIERVLRAPRILALDGVQDPGNAGTLIRTAAWFGIDAVVAGAGTVDVFNPKAVRSAMGGLFDVEVAEVDDLAEFLGVAAAKGFECYGADMAGERAENWQPGRGSVLVVGNEAHGISHEVGNRLDLRVTIGGGERQGVESLNVAQAAGILMYVWTARVSD